MDKRKFFSKFYIVLLTYMLVLPCYSKDVNGAEWKFYFKSQNLYFYDAQSINYLPDNSVRVFIKIISEAEEGRVRELTNLQKVDPTVPDNWPYWTILYEINCKDRTFKVLQLTQYNTKNETIYTTSIEKPSFNYISPETMMEALSKNVCVKKD
jgi:hypothetical protein